MSALQIKSYLIEQPSLEHVAKSSEIRRFALAQTSTGFYAQLIDKIQQAFGNNLLPQKDEIKTYWLDEENEMVCFSTDAELQYAVDLQMAIKMSGSSARSIGPYDTNIFKVYIVRKEAEGCKRSSSARFGFFKMTEDSEEDETKILHPGVVCDGCNGSVIGKRYKCKVCPDFDLCSACKDKNLHSEHEFTTIERPGRCPWMSGEAGRHNHGHRQGWKHMRQHWRQHMQQARQHAQQQQQQAEAHAQNIHETIRNFMPNIANSIPMVYNQEQLKNVGEYLRQFLDPFGIDVSYYVDNMSGAANGARSSTTSSSTTTTTSTDEKKKDEKKEEAEKPMTTEEEKLIPMQTEPTSTETPIVEKSVDSAVASAAAATTIASAPPAVRDDLIDLTRVSPPTMTTTAATPSEVPNPSSLFHAAASALQSVVEGSISPASATANKPTLTAAAPTPSGRPDQEFNGFNLIDMEKEIKFINCIEQLKSMGYADDGGWLTRLVISKEGNIHAVLDSLHPTKN